MIYKSGGKLKTEEARVCSTGIQFLVVRGKPSFYLFEYLIYVFNVF